MGLALTMSLNHALVFATLFAVTHTVILASMGQTGTGAQRPQSWLSPILNTDPSKAAGRILLLMTERCGVPEPNPLSS